MDRRIKKTQEAIYSVFIDLLKEKGFNKLSISDISERADINRGTFYFHFSDKYDLYEKCMDFYVGKLLISCSNETEIKLNPNAFLQIFKYLKDNYDIYRTLLYADGLSIFHKKFHNAIEGQLKKAINKMPEEIILSQEIASEFIINGFTGVVEWWINNSMPYSPEVMTEKLNGIFSPYTKYLV